MFGLCWQNGYGLRTSSPQASVAGPSMPLYRMAGSAQLPPPQRYMAAQHYAQPPSVCTHSYSSRHTTLNLNYYDLNRSHGSNKMISYNAYIKNILQFVVPYSFLLVCSYSLVVSCTCFMLLL